MMKIISVMIILSYLSAVDITFSVDVSNEDLTSGCSPTVAGTFNNWSSAYNLTDIGYGIWETTVDLNPNSYYEFKFGTCGWELEDLSPEGECTVTNYGYTNRFLNVTDENLSLETYYYASCDISTSGEIDENWLLVWSDEFDGPDIDMTKWSYDVGTGNWGWGNGEEQYYTDNSNNSFIEDGKLIIKAIRQWYSGSDYTSARMVTRNKGDWTYGRIEVRAKLPAGTGTWPAIWLLPTDYVYGGWPDSGEIDIMEAVGHQPGVIHGTAHTDHYNWFDGTPPPGGQTTVSDNNTQFHDYILEWTENSLKWYVDDTYYFTYSNNNQGWSYWPFDQDFHLLLNIAIGGTWGGQQGIDDSIFPVQMEVEYVRVYQGDGGPDPESSEVTFLVDMQNEQIDESGVYVSGGDAQFAGPSGILMSDLDNDNIWSVTIPLEPGTYTYKFRNGYYDYWDGPGWEDANSLEDCGVGEWNDREITVSDEDFVVGPYCFSSCDPCEGGGGSYSANFSIDMSGSGYPNADYDNVVINYSPNWWGWGVTLSDDDGDGVFTGSLDNLADGTMIEYVIAVTGVVDDWSGWGVTFNAPLDSECDFQPGDGYGNYGLTIAGADVEAAYCAGSCDEICGGSDCDTLGDVNNDNELNILDIVTIVNIILSDEMSDPCSDFNQDGTTNILDLVSLVSAILEN